MKVHLYTTDASAFKLLERLPIEDKVEIVAVIVPQNRLGSEKLECLTAHAKAANFPLFVQQRSQWRVEQLPEADMAISWFYSQILPNSVLERYPYGILNMHGGIIPEYRGANVLQWAIINGENEIGVTWHSMVEEVDAGPIWSESTVPMLPENNALDVRDLLINEGVRTFADAWNAFTDPKNNGRMPDLSNGRLWPSRKLEDGRIYPGMRISHVKNLIRALPKPWLEPTIKNEGLWKAVCAMSESHIDNGVPYKTSDGGVIYLVLSGDITKPKSQV